MRNRHLFFNWSPVKHGIAQTVGHGRVLRFDFIWDETLKDETTFHVMHDDDFLGHIRSWNPSNDVGIFEASDACSTEDLDLVQQELQLMAESTESVTPVTSREFDKFMQLWIYAYRPRDSMNDLTLSSVPWLNEQRILRVHDGSGEIIATLFNHQGLVAVKMAESKMVDLNDVLDLIDEIYRPCKDSVIDTDLVHDLLDDIRVELQNARSKFPGKNVTFAALVEEVGELATATFEESRDRVRKEAVQVAVMAMRMVLDGDHTFDQWRQDKGLDPLV